MTDSTITFEGGTVYGIHTSPRPLIEQPQIRAIGSDSYGVWGEDVLIDHSEIAGGVATIVAFAARIGASRLDGGAVLGGTFTCAGVYDESFTFFAGPACP